MTARKLFLAALMCGVCAAPAFAADAVKDGAEADNAGEQGRIEKMVDRLFEKIDTDKDGLISEDEQNAFNAKRFAESDANGDHKLSRDEVIADKKARAEKWKKKQQAAEDAAKPE